MKGLPKNLIIIRGAMGAGKTAVSRELQKVLPNNVFLDGDWCWDAMPFIVTDETKKMVIGNIVHLLMNFLQCSAYQNIIFCWVIHDRKVLLDITDPLSYLPLYVGSPGEIDTTDISAKEAAKIIAEAVRR